MPFVNVEVTCQVDIVLISASRNDILRSLLDLLEYSTELTQAIEAIEAGHRTYVGLEEQLEISLEFETFKNRKTAKAAKKLRPTGDQYYCYFLVDPAIRSFEMREFVNSILYVVKESTSGAFNI
uniref:Uncharacterized protein n=1 Tax=Ditylenchus dipsaci TaxID=166011 RepID=A0A915DAX1_9BILA